MRIDVLTLFPGMFPGVFGESIIKRACEKDLVDIEVTNIRHYARNKHDNVDDSPYGGGPGMVLMCQPIFDAVEAVSSQGQNVDEIVLLTPQGRPLDQQLAQELSQKNRIMLIAGHYEGFDERIRTNLATMEISVGDYILSGGEIAAMVVVDAVTRLIPGVLGDEQSNVDESFSENLLEYPHYTRPADFRGLQVPDVLLSGNHAMIDKWRQEQAHKRTQERRPDIRTGDNKKDEIR